MTSSEQSLISLSPCISGQILEINPTNGTSDTVLTIKGRGFPRDKNCLSVFLSEDIPCNINRIRTEAGHQMIECQVGINPNAAVNTYHPVSIKTEDNGLSLLKIEEDQFRVFYLKPYADSVTPSSG